MKVSPTLIALVSSCVVFLLTPYLPYSVLKYTIGTKIGSFVSLVVVLVALSKDNVLGLAVFLAVAALFLEQRRRTVEKVTVSSPKAPPFQVEQLSKPAPNIVPGEVHPERKLADVDDYSFEPSEESGTNKYEKVYDSYDEKHPLETVPSQPEEVSEMLQEKGLANIN